MERHLEDVLQRGAPGIGSGGDLRIDQRVESPGRTEPVVQYSRTCLEASAAIEGIAEVVVVGEASQFRRRKRAGQCCEGTQMDRSQRLYT